MIITVSPNIALDRVHVVSGFQPGQQSRAVRSFLQAGGSGVHASAVIQALGGQTLALGLLGGHTGALWQAMAIQAGLLFDMVTITGETRESFCLVDLDQGSQVEAVEPGPQVLIEALDALFERVNTHLPTARLLVLSGSLPPGLPDDSYARFISLAKAQAVPVLADLHSQPLRYALDAHPWLIKPNLAEFAELVGRTPADFAETLRLARRLADDQKVYLALSMSGAGLLLVTPGGEAWHLTPPAADMRLPGGRGQNVIGCGDALVGALAYEYVRGGDLLAAARLGLAAAHANLATFGVPEIDPVRVYQLVDQVKVESISD